MIEFMIIFFNGLYLYVYYYVDVYRRFVVNKFVLSDIYDIYLRRCNLIGISCFYF